MLKALISNCQPNSFTLIEDSVDVSGKFLLKEFIEASKTQSQKTLVLCFDKLGSSLKRDLNIELPTAEFIDCCFNYQESLSGLNKPLRSILESHVSFDEKVTIIIDSLTSLYYNNGLQDIYRCLHSLLTKPIKKGTQLMQLVAVVHSDTLPDTKSISTLSHLASTEILLVPTNLVNRRHLFIKHAKKNGKIVKQEEYCWYDKSGVLLSEEKKTISKVEDAIDPNGLTTFRLSLEETEIKARSELRLPYVKTSEDGDTGGKIFYTPDDNDDWDEEDPDDDLDI